MSHIKLVTSGKGGAGKSAVSVYTGAALARHGKRVLLLEMDAGLRGLDIALGVSDRAVFDLSDVLQGRCEPVKAIVECSYLKDLHLMPAPMEHQFSPLERDLRRLCRGLSGYYDYLIIDTPAGLGVGFEVSLQVADSAFVVTTPDPVSVRDAAAVAGLIFERGTLDCKLVINRIPNKPKAMLVPDLDTVIDTVGAQLIGAVLENGEIGRAQARGLPLSVDGVPFQEFDRIAWRMEGKYLPLSLH